MGNVETRNQIDAAIASSVSLLNGTTQKCRHLLSDDKSINIKDCDDVVLKNIDISGGGSMDINCSTTAATDNEVKNQIDTTMKNLANSLNQALNFNPGSTKATNVTNLTQSLSTSIVNSYVQDCLTSVANRQTINITCPTSGGKAHLQYINFSTLNKSLINCTQESQTVNTIVQSLKTIVQQEATAKVAPLFSLGMIIMIVIIIFAVMFFGLGKSFLQVLPVILIVGVILVIAYIITASVLKWWPFQPKSE